MSTHYQSRIMLKKCLHAPDSVDTEHIKIYEIVLGYRLDKIDLMIALADPF